MKRLDKQRADGSTLIPQLTSVIGIVGSICSGKSTLLLNLLLDKKFYFQKFSRIIIFSPVIGLDRKLNNLLHNPSIIKSNQLLSDAMWKEECELIKELQDEDAVLPERPILPKFTFIDENDIHSTYTPDIITSFIAEQTNVINRYGIDCADNTAIIMEDGPAMSIWKRDGADRFSKMCLITRHLHSTLFYCSQFHHAIPKVVRANTTAMFLFDASDKEKDDMFESHSANLSKAVWMECFAIATNKPHSFLQVNLQNEKGKKLIMGTERYLQ
jgi:hypothetical protein